MCVYVSYTDETEVKNGRFLIAGYVANETDWPKFSEQWDKEIIKSEPPIPYLHMVDIRSKEWRDKHGITREQAEEKVNRAVDLIYRSSGLITAYVSNISTTKHTEMSKSIEGQGAEFKRHHNYPDYFAFIAYLWGTLNDVASHEPRLRKIVYFVSRKRYVSHYLESVREAFARALRELNSHLEEFLGDVLPLDMQDHMPLQAADVLCWHLQRSFVDDEHISENLAKLQSKPLVGMEVPDDAFDLLGEELMRVARENSSEAQRFSDAVSQILKVPHTEIKLRLAEEKTAKKRKKSKKSSTSRERA